MDELIYIPLEREGVPVQRAAPAHRRNDGSYVVLRPANYDPSSEVWRFPPGSIIQCEWIQVNHKSLLTAVRLASSADALRPDPIHSPAFEKAVRGKIQIATLILAAIYLVLTALFLTGRFNFAFGEPSLVTLMFLPMIMFGFPLLIWLIFFIQITSLTMLAKRMPFLANVLVSVFAAPIGAYLILRIVVFLEALVF